MTAVKSTDIAGVVRSLDADSLDVLMKYLYAGMAAPEKYNAGSLLAWHEVVRGAAVSRGTVWVPRTLTACAVPARAPRMTRVPLLQVVESAGLASIVRVLTDRKTA